MTREQRAEQLRRAIQMFIQSLPDDKAPEVASVYEPYRVGVAYPVDKIIRYGEDAEGYPQLYRIRQAHTSQADWPPDQLPALYTPIPRTTTEGEA